MSFDPLAFLKFDKMTTTEGLFSRAVYEDYAASQQVHPSSSPCKTYLNDFNDDPTPAVPKRFVCKGCGYIYEADTLPSDFVCPICRSPADYNDIHASTTLTPAQRWRLCELASILSRKQASIYYLLRAYNKYRDHWLGVYFMITKTEWRLESVALPGPFPLVGFVVPCDPPLTWEEMCELRKNIISELDTFSYNGAYISSNSYCSQENDRIRIALELVNHVI